MTHEQEFFLKVLSDHLAKRTTNAESNLNWNTLTYWARVHQVEGIVFYQCRDFIPLSYYSEYEKQFTAILYLYLNRKDLLNNVISAFNKHGIPILTVKGMEIADCYPVPALRTMGDSDILVHKEDKEKAGRILKSLGFQIGEKNPDYDWLCIKNKILFELHHNLIYQEIVTVDKQANFFNNYWVYSANGKLNWNFHFLYLLAHLRKHLMNKGVGFRMFMDLAVVMQKHPELDWSWIEVKLSELDMLKFARVCFALIECWFGIKSSINHADINNTFYKNATDKIFENGVFGDENKSNKDNDVVNQLTINGTVNVFSRLKAFWRNLVPGYNNMANSPYYHYVRGRRWLLPIAWINRIYRLFKGKTVDAKTIISRIMTSKEVVDNRQNELKEWGLKN